MSVESTKTRKVIEQAERSLSGKASLKRRYFSRNLERGSELCDALEKASKLKEAKAQGQRRQWQPTPLLLAGKSHGQRSLVGCSPWGRKKSDMTERLHFHFSLSCIGEGNGNPLQCSCLENPRDGGAWWAAIYRVSQSDMTEVT